jgi:hypothetical protein
MDLCRLSLCEDDTRCAIIDEAGKNMEDVLVLRLQTPDNN